MNMQEFAESDFVTKEVLESLPSRIGIFLSAGVKENGKYGVRPKFLIELSGGKQKFWNPSRTSVNNLVKAYGEESDGWIGKKVLFKIEKDKIIGEGVV